MLRRCVTSKIRTVFFTISSRHVSTLLARDKLILPDGKHIEYSRLEGPQDNLKPGIVYCSSFGDYGGYYADFLTNYCVNKGLSYLDYQHIAVYSEVVLNGKEVFIRVLDELSCGPQLVVGHGSGAIASFLGALERPERINGLISISNNGDYIYSKYRPLLKTDNMDDINKHLNYVVVNHPPGERHMLWHDHFEDVIKNLLLHSMRLNRIQCPVRFIHWANERELQYQTSQSLQSLVASDNVKRYSQEEIGYKGLLLTPTLRYVMDKLLSIY